MRKISLISIAMLIVSIPTFAGGILTNTYKVFTTDYYSIFYR